MVLKVGIISLIALFISVTIFTLIYKNNEPYGYTDAFYNSVMIQTLVGVSEPAEKDSTRLWMTLQALLSYILTAGIIVFVGKKLYEGSLLDIEND